MISFIALSGCGSKGGDGGGGGGGGAGSGASNGTYTEVNTTAKTGTIIGAVSGQDYRVAGGVQSPNNDSYALGGATITITHESLIEGGTLVVNVPSSGDYQIVLPAGTGYTIVFAMPGYESVTYTDVEIIADQTITLETAVLKNNALTVVVDGTVSNNGTGLSGVQVTIQCSGDNCDGIADVTTYTENDGTFYVNLPAGHCYTVTYDLAGYQSANGGEFCITDNGTVTGFNGTVTLNPIVTTGTLAGIITGETLAGGTAGIKATIQISKDGAVIRTYETDDDGNYSITLDGGSGYTATVVALGYTTITTGSFSIAAGETKSIEGASLRLVTGTLIGSVTDASGAAMGGVSISIYYLDGTVVRASTSTNDNGSFSIVLPVISSQSGEGDYYRVVFQKPGYVDTVYHVYDIFQSLEVSLQPVVVVIDGYGIVSGSIISSVDGRGVSGAVIKLRSGIDVKTGVYMSVSGATVTATSDANGAYRIQGLPAGSYTGEVVKSGYTTGYFTIVCVKDVETPDQRCILSPTDSVSPTSGRIEVVLKWGSSPNDIDAHFTGPKPDGSGRYHLYYVYSQQYLTGKTYEEWDWGCWCYVERTREYGPYANNNFANWNYKDYCILDVDDRFRNGPETVTVKQPIYLGSLADKVYRYAVHDYSNRDANLSKALSKSGAIVTVKRYDLLVNGSPLTYTFNIPYDKVGTVWNVFEMTYNEAYQGKFVILPKNTFRNESTSSNVIQ
ncbi:MAG TPA: carboxypeptidase-like regulatory domain-containing protein [Spirochaetota bacterium]|nr:carboxypeptidase-like regulatory domain-containing protein [Spirochaetota bacterium]